MILIKNDKPFNKKMNNTLKKLHHSDFEKWNYLTLCLPILCGNENAKQELTFKQTR